MDLGERLEQAIARASARGIPLVIGKPSPAYRNYKPHTDPPRRRDVVPATDDDLGNPGIPGVLTAEGRQTRSRVVRGFTHEELGFAAARIHPLELATVLWCLNADEFSRPTVKAQLLILAVELRETMCWPREIRRADCEITGLARERRHYCKDLCTLALKEGADPHVFGSEDARARFFGLSDKHWRRLGLANGYAMMIAHLTRWFDDGVRDLRQGLIARPT